MNVELTERMEIEPLLEPIPGQDPCGVSVRYEGCYDEIQEARRADDMSLPRDIWQKNMKVADWRVVERVCVDALTSKSKDLQLAAWLLESRTVRCGFSGAEDGMRLLLRLCERYWESAFPKLDEDDPDYRAAPFNWINEKLTDRLRLVPLIDDHEDFVPIRWADIKRLRWLDTAGGDSDSEAGAEKQALREAIANAPPQEARQSLDAIVAAAQVTRELEGLLDDQMGKDAPSLVQFRGALDEMAIWLGTWLHENAPPPEEEAAEPVEASDDNTASDGEEDNGLVEEQEGEASKSSLQGKNMSETVPKGPIRSREDAYSRLIEIADYLADVEPHSPTPYLIRRAVAWGGRNLGQLLQEFARDGLDLDALFALLGMEEQESARYTKDSDSHKEEEYS